MKNHPVLRVEGAEEADKESLGASNEGAFRRSGSVDARVLGGQTQRSRMSRRSWPNAKPKSAATDKWFAKLQASELAWRISGEILLAKFSLLNDLLRADFLFTHSGNIRFLWLPSPFSWCLIVTVSVRTQIVYVLIPKKGGT